MPLQMPEEALLTIQKRDLPPSFCMPQMELASHYSLGYLVSGDRRVITPYQQFDFHSGDVTVMPPMLYHRTFSLSSKPYINYLLKISPQLADQFSREVSAEIWREVFEQKIFSFRREDSEKVHALLDDMLGIYETNETYCDVLLKGLLFRLIILIRDANTRPDAIRFPDKLSEEIMETMYFIEQNCSEDIRLADAAKTAGFSEGHLSRLFVSQVGVPFSEYLVNVRLRHVKELLLNTDMSISEIANHTGFSNSDYLSACFHRHEGMSPTAFRKGASALTQKKPIL